MATIFLPRTAEHPELGPLILLDGLHNVDGLIESEGLRCIKHQGHEYVLQAELNGYCSLEDAVDLGAIVKVDSDDLPDCLRAAVQSQTSIDEQLIVSRDRLVRNVLGVIDRPPVTHPFVRPFQWPDVWTDAAHIAINTAGDFATTHMARAYADILTVVTNGLSTEDAFGRFHRTLLFLATPELDVHFPEVWRAGYGLLVMPNEMNAEAAVLRNLGRLIALFSGYRGTPEGSETPRSVMSDHLKLVFPRA